MSVQIEKNTTRLRCKRSGKGTTDLGTITFLTSHLTHCLMFCSSFCSLDILAKPKYNQMLYVWFQINFIPSILTKADKFWIEEQQQFGQNWIGELNHNF